MIVDSSVLVAILQQETEAVQFAAKLEEASICLISAISVLEARMVIESRFGDVGIRDLEALVRKSRLEIVPFDADQIAFAHQAFRFFGKGRHPARLNLGDCAVYALVKWSGKPLLCKGDDFARTDLTLC